MKKFIKVLMWVCFIILALGSLVALTINVEFEATEQDLLMYRLGGFLLLLIFALGFLLETDMFGVRKKLKLVSVKGQIIFWTVTSVMAIMVFCVFFGMTSENFRTEISASSSEPEPRPTTVPKPTKTSTPIPTITSKPTEKPAPTNTPKPTSIIKIATPTPTIAPENTDINGCVFVFEDAVYMVNGIEVIVHSVKFEKTDRALNGYSTTFEYTAKNTGTSLATLKFQSQNQFYFDNDKIALLAVQAMNSMKPNHTTSCILQPGEEIKNTKILLTACSHSLDRRIDNIDYPAVEIGDIMSTEPVTLDITFDGWVNDSCESMKVSFNINGGCKKED